MPTAVEVDGTQIWLHHSQLLHQETAWILATSGLTREIPSLGSMQARRRRDTCRRGTGLQTQGGLRVRVAVVPAQDPGEGSTFYTAQATWTAAVPAQVGRVFLLFCFGLASTPSASDLCLH
ncbi:hypothetical protein QTO34_008491 [Cnephaeus nilssonii]|uniref:Uncharacterized protein n=1 Tax=Cnephaeus nilssonii TaxID=3371016 RepID=A0AA40LWC3_CNENI|nr:hypothetical protein QTO34_008491 [Eptesicus nilssonii]